jgi:hypothetical protein
MNHLSSHGERCERIQLTRNCLKIRDAGGPKMRVALKRTGGIAVIPSAALIFLFSARYQLILYGRSFASRLLPGTARYDSPPQ